VIRETALALAHAHDQGVVHRDVKPDNILIDRSTGSSFVTDFGIARFGIGPISGSRTVLGTPEFMSPEQARGLALDARSDLYSLGVVGFYAASGRLPFAGDDPYVVMSQHVTDAAPALASVAPKMSPIVAGLVDQCLQKDPEQRPQSGTQVADELVTRTPAAPVPAHRIRKFLTLGRRWAVLAPLYLAAIGAVGLPLVLAQHLNLQGDLRILVLSATWVVLLPPLLLAVTLVRGLFRRMATLAEPESTQGPVADSA
jgi:serine/threonine protein kinase